MMKRPYEEWLKGSEELEAVGALGHLPERLAKLEDEKKFKNLHDYFLREGIKNELGEIKEVTSPELVEVLKIIEADYPDIYEHLILDVGDPKVDTTLQAGPAILGPEDKLGYALRIALSPEMHDMTDGSAYFKGLSEKRKFSMDSFKESLEKALGDKKIILNARLLKQIILLHEIGHFKFHLENFKKPGIDNYGAHLLRQQDLDLQFEGLPIPGAITSAVHRAWEKSKHKGSEEEIEAEMKRLLVEEYFKKFKPEYYQRIKEGELEYNFLKLPGETLAQLIARHEKMEQEVPGEKAADEFVVEFYKKYQDELFPKQK